MNQPIWISKHNPNVSHCWVIAPTDQKVVNLTQEAKACFKTKRTLLMDENSILLLLHCPCQSARCCTTLAKSPSLCFSFHFSASCLRDHESMWGKWRWTLLGHRQNGASKSTRFRRPDIVKWQLVSFNETCPSLQACVHHENYGPCEFMKKKIVKRALRGPNSSCSTWLEQ